ncbi:MAG: NAD(+) diphosphatase [Microbacterium sp.]|uniref:NAD(+) diphosphatase n=1 Tax=Microbacterium sp. TaxID=51671 RepID=UPI001AD05804|nr:NAD(+) diphosphatase [Microbacterium sp.]MBN9176008.1 NAD(+) diphosphatase [Microbacterium sp.]
MPGVDAPPPPLARAGIDRAAEERDAPDLVRTLAADPTTRVIAVHGDRALVAASGASLVRLAPSAVPADSLQAFLGRDADGAPVLLAVLTAEIDASVPDAAHWASLRDVGGAIDAVDAGLFVEAVALGRWIADAPFCPACGARTQLRTAGWARHCPACGREHFPRTDPAVIVAVHDEAGERLLLGKNALWADRNMYSTFAGFVEAGESLEAAIVREIREEAGVEIIASRYRGSQAWPYPRSLMLGFHSVAQRGATPRPDGVEIVDARWFTRPELCAALASPAEAGFALPGTASIARRLIEDWVAMSA